MYTIHILGKSVGSLSSTFVWLLVKMFKLALFSTPTIFVTRFCNQETSSVASFRHQNFNFISYILGTPICLYFLCLFEYDFCLLLLVLKTISYLSSFLFATLFLVVIPDTHLIRSRRIRRSFQPKICSSSIKTTFKTHFWAGLFLAVKSLFFDT